MEGMVIQWESDGIRKVYISRPAPGSPQSQGQTASCEASGGISQGQNHSCKIDDHRTHEASIIFKLVPNIYIYKSDTESQTISISFKLPFGNLT